MIGTEGAIDPDLSGLRFAWLLDEEQQSDPSIHAIIAVATGEFQQRGMIEAEDGASADVLIAVRTEVHRAGQQVYVYNVRRYVSGPSHSYEREVAVYDTRGRYVGTRREVVTERQPGYMRTEQRQSTSDLYQRLIEFSFMSATEFTEGSTEPFYMIGSQGNGSSDNLGPVGGCMLEMIFDVFPKTLSEPFTGRIDEQTTDYCNLPGF